MPTSRTLYPTYMELVILALVFSVPACTAGNRTAFAISTAALACDWGQTRSMAERDWPKGSYEANPVMGRSPSTGVVDIYFASAIVVNSTIYYFMPKKWKWLIPSVVTEAQLLTIIGNHKTTPGYCGQTWLGPDKRWSYE